MEVSWNLKAMAGANLGLALEWSVVDKAVTGRQRQCVLSRRKRRRSWRNERGPVVSPGSAGESGNPSRVASRTDGLPTSCGANGPSMPRYGRG
jgi:hypothetical protein